MKTKFPLTGLVLAALIAAPVAWAKEGARNDGKGGGGANPPGAANPSNAAKPGGESHGGRGGGDHKIPTPSGGGGSGSFRPSGGGEFKHANPKPSGGGARLPVPNPVTRPEARPQRPADSGGGLPSFGGGARPNQPNRPSTFPGGQPGWQPGGGGARPNFPGRPPQAPVQKPDRKPEGGGDFLDMRPDKPKRPGPLPGGMGDGMPSGQGPGSRPRGKPDRPPTLPGNTADGRPNRPGFGNRPGLGENDHMNRPNLDYRPGKPPRPPRPDRPEKWQNVENKNVNQWNTWKRENSVQINTFQVNRTQNWNNINRRYQEHNWAGRYHSDEYWGWRREVHDFRRARGEEIWHSRQDYWNDSFDRHWWNSCWWRSRPAVVVSVNISPWWWWRPFAWANAGAFFGESIAMSPVIYDPGTTVIYEGDTYYINGEPSGTAAEARRAAIELATPAIDEVPVPEPAAEGEPEAWLPLGVWALTQQEQGDATMFMQFSVDKEGLLAGAYKNVMTGDEQPIIGQLDKKTQRIAWHVGDATQTVYETGLAGLENDVASVFVHFGEKQTQTWLLVRLPSPEMPPGPVKLSELGKE